MQPSEILQCSMCLRRVGIGHKRMANLFPGISVGAIYLAWRKAGFKAEGKTWRERERLKRLSDIGKRERPKKEPKPKPPKKQRAIKPRMNLIGQTFGHFTVIAYGGVKKGINSQTHVWLCLCSCGKEWTGATALLRGGKTKTCGCGTKLAARKRWQSDDPKMQERRNIALKLRAHMKDTIRRIKAKGGTKAGKTIELIGCSLAMLREHIESQFSPGMTWENHGAMWEIDHIMPLARFDLTNAGHARMAARYTNLQPLWKEQNAAKSDKLIDHQAILL